MSGRKSNLLKFQSITAGNLASASITSAVTNILQMDNIAMQFNWSGTSPVGAIAIQVSIDYAQDAAGNITNAGNWTALPISPAIAVSGNSGSAFVDINQSGASWIRAVYTKTSGVGSLNGFVTGKML